ncbi:MAG TPA: ECF transporter S component [Acidimicrobiia bacterium]|nr:ECF transporter S component [Acidimicrobiia bacterium]
MAMAERATFGGYYDLREDLRLNTMDIVVAVLLGVIEAAIEIVGALGFTERLVWATGAAGFAIYAFYNGMTWILYYAGAYLRKRSGVILLAAIVTALVRWFFGDPDGPVLLFYGIFPAIFGMVVFALMQWRGGKTLFAISAAVTAAMNQVATFVGQGGFQIAEGAGWGTVSIIIGFLGGLLWGPIAWWLGRALEKAGVPSVDEPPSWGGGKAAMA